VTEIRAIILLILGEAAAIVAISIGLGATGATDQQIATAWMLSIVITGLIGGFIVSEYPRSKGRR
jgi:hypothetical protein